MYVNSPVTFTARSALCEASLNMNTLIIGSFWAGARGAGMCYKGHLQTKDQIDSYHYYRRSVVIVISDA
jgi:hypothetical protein